MTLMRTSPRTPETTALSISSIAAEPAVCLPERLERAAGFAEGCPCSMKPSELSSDWDWNRGCAVGSGGKLIEIERFYRAEGGGGTAGSYLRSASESSKGIAGGFPRVEPRGAARR